MQPLQYFCRYKRKQSYTNKPLWMNLQKIKPIEKISTKSSPWVKKLMSTVIFFDNYYNYIRPKFSFSSYGSFGLKCKERPGTVYFLLQVFVSSLSFDLSWNDANDEAHPQRWGPTPRMACNNVEVGCRTPPDFRNFLKVIFFSRR